MRDAFPVEEKREAACRYDTCRADGYPSSANARRVFVIASLRSGRFIGNARDEDEAFFRVALRHTRLRPGFAHSRARARTSLLRMHTSSDAPRCRARHANHDIAAGPRLDSLPVDVLLEVTKPLGGADLLRCAAVSRGWRDALEPAFESRCVSRGRVDRAWLFPATGSIDGGETLRASDESRTWRERFQDAFCVWCREAPRAPVTLVAEPRRCAVVRGWTKLAHHGLVPAPPRFAADALRQSRVTLCGRCLARTDAKDLTRTYGMRLSAPPSDEESARKK